MYSFKAYYLVEAPRLLSGKGVEAAHHANDYIRPNIGSKKPAARGKNTLRYAGPSHPKIKDDQEFHVHGHRVDENGEHHVRISTTGNAKDSFEVKQRHLRKASKSADTRTEGHKYEEDVVKRLKGRGVMPHNHHPQGSKAGTDATILNRRVPSKEHKREGKLRILKAETKADDAAWGQLTIHHDPAKGGWHISDQARKLRPRFARHIERSGVLDHMNKHEPTPAKVPEGKQRVRNHTIHHHNMEPAQAYLQDHGVHVLQVKGRGTYHTGTDHSGYGLSPIKGEGQWTVRQKNKNTTKARTVQFSPRGKHAVKPSSVDLDDDKHLEGFAKHVGARRISVNVRRRHKS